VFDHVGLHTSDSDASERFYETVLGTLGIEQTYKSEHLVEWGDFALSPASAERPVTRRLHIGFVAPSREQVDAFWRVGTEAGYRDAGAPGPRPQYSPDYYGFNNIDTTSAGIAPRRSPVRSPASSTIQRPWKRAFLLSGPAEGAVEMSRFFPHLDCAIGLITRRSQVQILPPLLRRAALGGPFVY
jgi:catechol 2,3-dioxygenase-like lactoylglutathione lyase family enzyme